MFDETYCREGGVINGNVFQNSKRHHKQNCAYCISDRLRHARATRFYLQVAEDQRSLSAICRNWNKSQPRCRLSPLGNWWRTAIQYLKDVKLDARAYQLSSLPNSSDHYSSKPVQQAHISEFEHRKTAISNYSLAEETSGDSSFTIIRIVSKLFVEYRNYEFVERSTWMRTSQMNSARWQKIHRGDKVPNLLWKRPLVVNHALLLQVSITAFDVCSIHEKATI